MFLALAAIAEYLRQVPHFQAWSVRDGLITEPRQEVPAVDVRYEGATVGDAKGVSSINVSPVVVVTVAVQRGEGAAAQLDAAFVAAIASLCGFKVPGATASADKWTALVLAQVRVFDPADSQVGFELIFTHGKRFAVGTCGVC